MYSHTEIRGSDITCSDCDDISDVVRVKLCQLRVKLLRQVRVKLCQLRVKLLCQVRIKLCQVRVKLLCQVRIKLCQVRVHITWRECGVFGDAGHAGGDYSQSVRNGVMSERNRLGRVHLWLAHREEGRLQVDLLQIPEVQCNSNPVEFTYVIQ